VVVIAGCGGSTDAPRSQVGDAPLPRPSPLGLCALCTSDAACDSGICRMYGDGYRKCSLTCTPLDTAPQCTAPAEGACNGMGYCMCPFYSPPADAGVPPVDAAMAATGA